MDYFDKGDVIRLSAAFTNQSGIAVDPTAVVYKIRDPSGNTETLTYGVDSEVVQESSGNYYVDQDGDEAGLWWWRVEATGTGQCAEEASFRVNESEFD